MQPIDRRHAVTLGVSLVSLPTLLKRGFSASSTTGGDLTSDGIITLGADATYPPHTYIDQKTHRVIGLDVDLANEIAKRLGVHAQFVTIEWAGIIPALQAKRFDAITAEMNITPERAAVLDFSDPVVTSGQVVVVRSDNTDIHSPSDLRGKAILVPLGTTEEAEARKYSSDVRTFPTLAECFRELGLGRGTAIIIDLAVASFYIKQSPNIFKVATSPVDRTQSAFAFRKDDPSRKLRLQFNKILADMRRDGTFSRILNHWIIQPPASDEQATPAAKS